MSAREAYIAGRSGGSRPSRGSGGSSGPGSSTQRARVDEVRQQQAYDSGQQERQREQILQSDQGIQGLSQRDQKQAKTIAQNTGKDPYDTLNRAEEIEAGYPKTGIEKLQEATGVKLLNPTFQFMGIGAKALQGLLDKTFKPQLSDFSNPNFLAVLDAAFKTGKLNETDWTKKYQNLIDSAYDDEVKENLEKGVGNFDTNSLFNLSMDEATANVKPGSGTQRITNPEAFYDDFTPQTSGDLANLAGLDVSSNPALADRIFAARMELDRMGKNPMTGESQGGGNQGGGGGGGAFVPPVVTPDDPIIPQDPTLPPGVTPPATTPKFPGSVVTDYTQLGLPQIYGNPQMPNYATFNREASMPVGLQDYLDNLRKRFGIG
ncbi:hypothetical protein N9U06_01725 [Gammaproteobacteria bacterium]|nr:hypothetical protein [Gammaproteobacteria bacterium]